MTKKKKIDDTSVNISTKYLNLVNIVVLNFHIIRKTAFFTILNKKKSQILCCKLIIK